MKNAKSIRTAQKKKQNKKKNQNKTKSSKKQIQYIHLYDNLYVFFYFLKLFLRCCFVCFYFFCFCTSGFLHVQRSGSLGHLRKKRAKNKRKAKNKKCGNKKRPHINVYWICVLFGFSFAFVFFEIVIRCGFFAFLPTVVWFSFTLVFVFLFCLILRSTVGLKALHNNRGV